MCVNFRGGAFSRGGLAFVGRCKQTISGTGPPRPITFQFSITQGYVLEFGDNYLRFCYQGGYILEPPIAITGATQANPCVISVAGTPFANGDWVFITGVVGMTQLNGNTYIVAGVAAGHFSLHDLDGNNVNSSAFTAYTSGGTVSRLYTVATPYAAIDLPYLKVAQSADVMTLTCSNPVTATEYPPYQLTRFAADSWTLVPSDFSPVSNPPAWVQAASASLAPTTGVNASFAYQVTSVSDLGVESIASVIAPCYGADLQVEAGSNTVTWAMSPGAKYYNVYRTAPSPDTTGGPVAPPDGAIYGYIGSAFGTQFIDNNSVPDLSQTPPIHANPFARGQILAVDITSGGSGLAGVTWAITTATGADFYGYPAVSGGALGAFPIINNGENYTPGDTIAFNGAGFAAGSITFAVNPVAGSTITLNGVVWLFVVTVTAANQTQIAATDAATISRLVADLSSSPDPALTVASYATDAATGKVLVITYDTAGPAGNTYTLAASVAAVSGPTLTGGSGTAFPGVPTATLEVGPESGTYPGVNAYFQQRLFFANSFNNPDTLWATQTGRYNDFDKSIPVRATDAITASPWTEQVNGIQWLVPMPGGLIAMTGNRAWQIVGEGSYQLNVQPVTPSTIQAQPQAFNGCSATIQPVIIDYDVIYVEAIGNTTVRDLSWNFLASIYTGADLTILSSHLFLYRQIVQWAWARIPYKVIWACCNDGTMLSLTYMKEQEVYGWARHDTVGLVVGITSVAEPPVNAVYAITQRFTPNNLHGIYCMERMDDRIWQSVEDAYAVDSGVSNPLVSPATWIFASGTTNPVTFEVGAATFSAGSVGQVIRMGGGIAVITTYVTPTVVIGTWSLPASNGPTGIPYAESDFWTLAAPVTTLNIPHLAGMTLVGLADGVPLSGLVVGATGTVTLPFAASNVKVGLPYLPQFQSPYANGQGVVQGARKVVPAVTVRVAASAPFQVGTNQPDGAAQNPPQLGPTWTMAQFNPLNATGGQTPPTTYTSPGGQTVTQLWTGDLRGISGGAEWNSKGQVAVQQPLPMALEILAVMPESLEGDVPEETYRPQQGQGGAPQGPRPPGPWMLKGPRI